MIIKKEVKIGLIALGALIVLVLIISLSKKDGGSSVFSPVTKAPTQQGEELAEGEEVVFELSEEAGVETKKILDEFIGGEGVSTDDLETALGDRLVTINLSSEASDIEGGEGETKVIKAISLADGSSLVDLNSGQVIRETGEAVNNAARPSSPEAPSESRPLASPDDALESSIKISGTMDNFSPNTFTVKRNQVVNLVVTNNNSIENSVTFSVIFRFDDPSLGGVVVGLAKGETKSITFNAPSEAGEYVFFNSMFNHRDLGAVGKMIVE